MDQEKQESKIWKKDFPVRRVESISVSRRDFARFLSIISGGMAAGTGLVAAHELLKPEHTVSEQFVCPKSEIPVGGTKSFVLQGSTVPYILIHTEEGAFYCYEQKCTHLACAVYYKPGTGKIECPCHNGWFDARTGEAIQGPPPRALPSLEVLERDGELYVKSFDKIS
ncbi:MAG: Rieske (2Fe-2S) protein [Saprospiraceae bacterium]